MNSSSDIPTRLHLRIRWLTALFIAGLVVSGATAIPLATEVDWLAGFFGVSDRSPSLLGHWLLRIQDAPHE